MSTSSTPEDGEQGFDSGSQDEGVQWTTLSPYVIPDQAMQYSRVWSRQQEELLSLRGQVRYDDA